MQLGMIGLGRMGANMVRRLIRGGHECVVFDRSPQAVAALAKDEAARFGLPGRTVTVGRRNERPSMKPFRVMSYTMNSPMAFCAP